MSDVASEIEHGRSFSAVLLPILAFVACMVCVPPMITHIRSHNLAACVLISWIIIENLFNFINPLIWPTDSTTTWWQGAGLCDLEVKLELAASVAFISALVCLYRQLAFILDTRKTILAHTWAERRRKLTIELVLCFGLPVYIMIAHYIVQPTRYYIFAIGGCVPSFDNSWPSIVLVFIWPVGLWITAAAYCALVVHRLVKYRRQFSSILSASQSKFGKSRFIRLFIMATVLILVFLPVAMYLFARNVDFQRHPYSWKMIHAPGWNQKIVLVPSEGNVSFDRWLQVGTGYIVFISFGFGQDAVLMYKSWLKRLLASRLVTWIFKGKEDADQLTELDSSNSRPHETANAVVRG